LALHEPDATGVKQPAERPTQAEVEDRRTLLKELALLGKEQREARQVDLLVVSLDLREVGVRGDVE